MSSIALGCVLLALLVTLLVRYSIVFPRLAGEGPLPPLSPVETALKPRLMGHIAAIASTPHNLEHPEALEQAARYIETSLANAGHSPVAHVYEVAGMPVRNIEVVIEPEDHGSIMGTYVVGAHYDSPDDSPGANDNGTGVAALLELASLLRAFKPRRHRLRLVFFVNEEAPYGKTPDMGSLRHATHLREKGEAVLGMIALETIGYFSNAPGSQAFPAPFGLVYPTRGDFIAFVGLPGSRRFLHRAIGAFRAQTHFPTIGGVAPGFLEGIDLSDHWAYHQLGFPALMVTDTAPFRNPYYHTHNDRPENVDYESLARITKGLERMLRDIVR